ncbi:MAG TPA: DUF2975 domain-containing protein [Candidatus Paceibacterota bacterium]
MKNSSTLILKAVIVLLGLGVLALCIFALPSAWKGVTLEYPEYPQVVYAFHLIFLGMYISAIPFYVGLYQGLKLLSFIDKNTAFSKESVQTLKIIKFCALVVGIIYISGTPLLYPFAEADDAPGVLVIGFVIACAPVVVSIFAAVLEKLLKNALDIKSENDLTV